MEKDKYLMVSEGTRALARLNAHLGLTQKILSEGDTACPLTLDWWHSLTDEWKAIFCFHVKFNSKIKEVAKEYLGISCNWTIMAWYNQDLETWKAYERVYKNINSDIPLGLPNIDGLFLQQLYQIERLFAVDFHFDDINPLSSLNNLKFLDLGLNFIDDIEPLRQLKKLRELIVSTHSLTKFDIIRNFSDLEILDISNGKIEDLNFLNFLINLKQLDVSSAEVSTFTIPITLKNLEFINLSSNEIDDLDGLVGLTSLKHIDLAVNKIYDIIPLTNLPNLEELNLSYNQIKNIMPLSKLPKLKKLEISENHVTFFSIQKFKMARPDVEIKWE